MVVPMAEPFNLKRASQGHTIVQYVLLRASYGSIYDRMVSSTVDPPGRWAGNISITEVVHDSRMQAWEFCMQVIFHRPPLPCLPPIISRETQGSSLTSCPRKNCETSSGRPAEGKEGPQPGTNLLRSAPKTLMQKVQETSGCMGRSKSLFVQDHCHVQMNASIL